jgi:uncharacterized protein with beta-barrel porin domain
MAGYDRVLTKKSAVGVVFSHSQPKLQQGWSRVAADDWLFGVHYADRFYERYEVKLWGSYGRQQYRLRRHIPISVPEHEEINGAIATDYGGNTVALSGMVSAPYSWRKGIMRPFAGVDLYYIQQEGAKEEGFDPIALRYGSSDWTQFFGRIGLRSDFGWERWHFTNTLAYSRLIFGYDAPHTKQHDFHRVKPHDSFTIRGNNTGGDFLEFGFGAQVYLCKDKEGEKKKQPSSSPHVERFKKDSMVFLQYNGSYGVRSDHQTASMGYQFVF